jgi:hypothetical protein
MIELLKARLDLLFVEMETVTLLGNTAASDSPHRFVAMERKMELKQEISRLHESLGNITANISECDH